MAVPIVVSRTVSVPRGHEGGVKAMQFVVAAMVVAAFALGRFTNALAEPRRLMARLVCALLMATSSLIVEAGRVVKGAFLVVAMLFVLMAATRWTPPYART
jgi:hypothetical protein